MASNEDGMYRLCIRTNPGTNVQYITQHYSDR